MSHTIIFITPAYERRLSLVEDFILASTENSLSALEKFLDEHDSVLDFLKLNPTTAGPHPQTGDQSWPFGDGRYRLFFKLVGERIYLLDLIDNRMSNPQVYPENLLPTYDED
jgi:hypothetical protein